ncbi:MAG: hypothetical protein OEM82_07485 [Acidobacteriota bacterium]|nr:hypothetical protein [Acidobacteriota bacterium]MDH3529836.1 hypothetical protein [Acidobacteriota bacterium]
MIRNVLAVVAGVFLGNLIFFLVQTLALTVSPTPEGWAAGEEVPLKVIIENLPLYAWLMIILGYSAGSFAGGIAVGRIARSATLVFPLFLALFFMIGWLVNVMTIPHPAWASIVVFLVFVPFSFSGHRFGLKYKEEWAL